jgi:hypothetical protein
MLEMNPEIRAQWITALRSGDYEQGRSVLRQDDLFCCLGVLCDLAVKANVIAARKNSDGVWFYGRDWDETLPEQVMEWAGISPSRDVGTSTGVPRVVVIPDDGDQPEDIGLASLNDEYKWSFARIADAIEDGELGA